MWQIREGLKANIDVSIYAKSDFYWKKMEQIRFELLQKKYT